MNGTCGKLENVRRPWDLEKFRARSSYMGSKTLKISSSPRHLSHETWKISELSPICGSWDPIARESLSIAFIGEKFSKRKT